MKLEFLSDISNGGTFAGVMIDQVIRLYDFNKVQAEKFSQKIQEEIIEKENELDLSQLDFIEKINCNLVLCLSNTDMGIKVSDNNNYTCEMTKKGYRSMINLLEPFCITECNGYQWLYEIDTPIEFFFHLTELGKNFTEVYC